MRDGGTNFSSKDRGLFVNMVDIFKLDNVNRELPIEALHLPVHIYNKLKTADISSIGHMLPVLRNSADLLNRTQKDRVRAVLTSFHKSIGDDGEPNWAIFCETEQITMLPKRSESSSNVDILANLAMTVEEILTFGDADPKKWPTIQYRFGLKGKSILTLDEIGQAFGKITREAVRQVERKGLFELRSVILDGSFVGRRYRVDERVLSFIKGIGGLIRSSGFDYATESELFALIGNHIDSTVQPSHEPALRLLFNLLGFSEIRELPEALPSVWKVNEVYPEAKLQKALTLVATILTGEYLPPIDEFELLAQVNRKMTREQVLSAGELSRLLKLCHFVETTEDGRIQAKFEHIGSRAGQAERLLVEAGNPTSVNELVREMNRRLHAAGRQKVEVLNIANTMSSDKRFVSVGSSGLRGLARWENVEARNIVEVMEDAFVSLNRPAEVGEIFAYVNERRPATLNSIKIYLEMQDRFLRTGRKQWGLSTWAEARRLNVEYKLNKSPRAPRRKLKATKFDESAAVVKEHLENAPDHEALLSTLVADLIAKLGMRDKTAYQYIGRMDFIEKIRKSKSQTLCGLVR